VVVSENREVAWVKKMLKATSSTTVKNACYGSSKAGWVLEGCIN